uniref:Ig-like domain-containing protein n=1 Tax=Oncorhynchus kisutch TaxID=8019 RepID=A0A8C7K779_ONCKI
MANHIVLYSNLNVFCVDMSTGRHVSVQTGGSITIPCSYDQYYINHVKYWCKGTHWTHLTLTRTSDANNRTVFTVTMSGLKMENTDWYWCRVGELEMPVHITVSTQAGAYGVSTVSKVSVKTGNYITIPCRYDQRYIQYVKYWCQGDYWNSCSALVRTDQPKISGTVSISDDVTRRIFSVNMTDLQPEDSGYYWCAVETAGRDQNTYLHLSVTTGKIHATLYFSKVE